MARTLTESLDNLYTTTWQNMKSTVIDQIFDSTPFWFWMKDKNKLESVAGGRYLTEPLQYAKNESVSWIGKGGTVSMNDYEFLTTAKYDWKYLVANIVRFGVDDQQNRGKNQIISLMNSKFTNTQNSLVDEMESKLFASAASGDEIDGLQHLVRDDPTSDTSVGEINQSTYTWWRNQTKSMTGLSCATNLIPEMRTMRNNCQNNLAMDAPDIIVSGQTPYEYYEDVAFDKYQVQNTKLAEMGFANQTFKGIPMIWSPSCADTRMYFLNTKFITFAYDPMMNFDMTEWKPIPDQVNDRAAQIILAGSFKVSRRRCQGVLHTIDTA
jgi:hypothetical protein